MKIKIASWILIGLCSSRALANDGGVPYIKVDSLKTKLANGQHLSFKGGDAFKLYSVLPQDFVWDVSRSLVVTSKDRSFSISCSQKPTKESENSNTPVGDPKTTVCSVQVDGPYDPSKDEGDSWIWEPRQCNR
jgi:hypothetical protein